MRLSLFVMALLCCHVLQAANEATAPPGAWKAYSETSRVPGSPTHADLQPKPELKPETAWLFRDDFASGDLSHVENGIRWGGTRNTAVIRDSDNKSGFALRFRYSNPESNSSFAEQRLSLDRVYPELWIEWRMVVPRNFQHPDGPSSDNNKLIRLWSGDQADGNNGYGRYYVKQGYSLLPMKTAALESMGIAEFGHSTSSGLTGVGPFGAPAIPRLISKEDYAKEITWVMQFKVDTSGAGLSKPHHRGGNGIQRIWKNGVLVGSFVSIANTPARGTNGYAMIYLHGADNSDFHGGTEPTDFLTRELVIAERNIFGVVH